MGAIAEGIRACGIGAGGSGDELGVADGGGERGRHGGGVEGAVPEGEGSRSEPGRSAWGGE